DVHRRTRGDQRAAEEEYGLHRQPSETAARERHPDQRQAGCDRDQYGTDVVDTYLAFDRRHSQVAGQYDQADQRERHTYEEAPAPAEPGRIDDHAADQRAADRSDGHRGAEVAVVAAAITRRDDGADD